MDIETNHGPNEIENNIVNTLEIFHLNARSMRNKLNYIHDIADTFHILCITETHLDNSITMEKLEDTKFKLWIIFSLGTGNKTFY